MTFDMTEADNLLSIRTELVQSGNAQDVQATAADLGPGRAGHAGDLMIQAGYYAVAVRGQAVRHYRIGQDGSIHEVLGRRFRPRFLVTSPAVRADILRAIELDPAAAQLLYGQSLGRCAACGRPLVAERSLSAGVVPTCQQHRSRLLKRL